MLEDVFVTRKATAGVTQASTGAPSAWGLLLLF